MCPGQGLMASLVPSYWVLVAPSPPHTGRDNTKNVHPAKTPRERGGVTAPAEHPGLTHRRTQWESLRLPKSEYPGPYR